jgi:demethylmenaquinone methyltransferase/2-methoxy-6-polyprenyl-1,4-benzoquinol methylase
MTKTTDFGFEKVPEADKARRVAGVFDSVASRYDLMNDLMSAGLHRVWKRFTVEQSGLKPGQRVLDVAGGTADLAIQFARRVGASGEVVLTDINPAMLVRLRNMTHKDRALAEMCRVLRPGGRLLVLEFSRVWQPLQPLYDAYSLKVLPLLGKLVANDSDSYRYLAESIRVHPDQEQLKLLMEQAGLERVEYFNLSAGVVALHRGYRM